MYKTVYHRYTARRDLANAALVLRSGAVRQLANSQINCGMELASMLLEAYSEAKAPADAVALGSIQEILDALPQPLALPELDSSSELEETGRFVSAALRWATKAGADAAAVQRIHDRYAAWVWAAYGTRQLARAALHFSRGADAAAYARVLLAASEQACDGAQEADLFVTRAVLQTLACARPATRDRQLQHAEALLEACKAQQPALADAPLAHFCGLLLQALRLRKPALVTLLQGSYGPSLAADPSFDAFIASIEAAYFDIRPAGGAGGGLLGGLLKSLLEGDEFADD
jgi:hypothetical protein